MDTSRSPATVLLGAEHAAVQALACASTEAHGYRDVLAAVGGTLGWDFGAAWEVAGDELRCVETWRAAGIPPGPFSESTRTRALARGEGLPGRVWDSGAPAWITDPREAANFPRAAAAAEAGLQSAFCFPVHGADGVLGAIEFFTRSRREPDAGLLATMDSLGTQIGQFVERCRAQAAVAASEARKSAILDAAFDCIVTMDADGRIVEVNAATERTFGYQPGAMDGGDLAELIIPPQLREAHRHGLARYLATGKSEYLGQRIELPAMRADGSEFPAELTITQPELPGEPVFTGYLRDVTERVASERAQRRLADEQAALRRVATAVASEAEPRLVFERVTEEVGRLLEADSANMVRYEGDGTGTVLGGWSADGVAAVPVGMAIQLDGDTVTAKIWRSGRPERVETYEGLAGKMAEWVREQGFRAAAGAPIELAGRLWGAVTVSTVHPEPFPAGAEERIADFARLAAQALANAEAREKLAASRVRLVEASDAARRRLERNLHDGAQQRLVALALSLRVAAMRSDSDAAREAFEQAGADLKQALEELRELARGIHPAVLTDRGLGPALDMLAARAPVPVRFAVQVSDRLPEPVEAAIYYVIAESLTNVAKYAQASVARVRVAQLDGHARVEVVDDGVGGARARPGSGLRGLSDRVEALGGTFDVRSPAGAGTTVRAEIPS